MTDEITVTRSVSQYNSYNKCPMAYKLERIDGAWQRPAAWLPQGSAVHEAAEAFERSWRTMTTAEAVDVFAESYTKHVNRYAETTPNLRYWFNSGPYRGAEDIERRFTKGKEQTEAYVDYYTQGAGVNEPIAVVNGEPMIEAYFKVDLGQVAVRGYIDAVVERQGSTHVRDNKTGLKPGDAFQLGVYAEAVSQRGTACTTGDYWMGKTGKPTKPYDLSVWDTAALTAEFEWLDEKIKAKEFPAKPGEQCKRCSVADSCAFRADR